MRLLASLLLLGALTASSLAADHILSFRADLRLFGYSTGQKVPEYSSVIFLSNDVLLVSINQWRFGPDASTAKLIVFELLKKGAIRQAVMPVRPWSHSVAPLNNSEFLVLTGPEVTLCTAELRCEKSFETDGLVSNLDQENMKWLKGGEDLVLRPEESSVDGSRSLGMELRSTTWNKTTHPLDIDEPAPPNYRRIDVYDKSVAKVIFSLEYNPKNHIVPAALSPNGAKLAIVRDGKLEVYDLA